jgi:hypothetical protein
LLLFFSSSFANIDSTSGKITFSSDVAQQSTMTLNSVGLGIHTDQPRANLHVHGNTIITSTCLLGNITSNSNLHINGSVGFSYQTTGENILLGDHSHVFTTSEQNQKCYLPDPETNKGKIINIKKISSQGTLEVFNDHGIDMAQNIIFSLENQMFPSTKLFCDGSQWYILEAIGKYESDAFCSDNLVLYLKFDDIGEIKDYGPNDYTVNRNNFSSSDNGFVTGKRYGGLEFDGIDDSLSIAHHENLYLEHAASVSVWVKRLTPSPGTDESSEFDSVFQKGVSYQYFPRINHNDNIQVRLHFIDGSMASHAVSDGITDSDWHHLVCCFDSETGRIAIYIDGEQRGLWTGYSGKTIVYNSDAITIGKSSPLYGRLDELRLYDRYLEEDLVNRIYLSTKNNP